MDNRRLKFYKVLFIMVFLVCSLSGMAQTIVKGVVKDSKDGSLLPGVSITVKDAAGVGTSSGIDGTFTLKTQKKSGVLKFSFIGYVSKEVSFNDGDALNVLMDADNMRIQEVVVTALGISKQSKSLTYSTQSVKSDELNRVKDVNMITSLAGKSAGVVIRKSASGLGGSAKISIRGDRSLQGSNQPLYVVDGVPINNSVSSQPVTTFGGNNDSPGGDSGDGISNLNPDDIESMSVLKGASASALYGSQAANGVILITTKKGKSGKTSVTFNSNLAVNKVFYTPDFQNSYGKTDGDFTSWGKKSNMKSYDNIDNFFETGVTAINSLSISSGNDKYQTYFSYANTTGKGVVENNELKKHNITFREIAKVFNDKITLDANVNIMSQTIDNRAPAGAYYFNPLVGLYRFPRGVDISGYKNQFEKYNSDEGYAFQQWIKDVDSYEQNPWWLTNRIKTTDQRNRAITSLSAKYDILPWLTIQARGNVDYISDNSNSKIYASTSEALSSANGRYIYSTGNQMQMYGDLLLSFNKELSSNFAINGAVGTSINRLNVKSILFDNRTQQLSAPNSFNIASITNPYAANQVDSKKELQSVFATAQLGYRSMLFLDVTARNDWSSALAFTDYDKKGFFYPSVGLTGIISDMVKLPDFIDFAKVRASWAQVGNDIPIYLSNPKPATSAGGTTNQNQYKSFNLKPEISTSIETGIDLRLFKNLLTFDLSLYKTNTKNQFFIIPAAPGDVYTQKYINAGNIENKGIELVVGINPLRNGAVKWNSTINFALNRSKVVELTDEIDRFSYAPVTNNGYMMYLEKGGSLGDLYTYNYERDNNGAIKYDKDNLPIKNGSFKKVGNTNPDFNLGWSNSVSYKNFNINFLVDGRFGGNVISMTQADLDYYGVTKETAKARDKGYVMLEGHKITEVKGFYQRVGGRDGVLEQYVYSATNVRLRELSLGVDLFTGKIKTDSFVKGINFSLVGRNLFFFYNNAPYDPDATLSVDRDLQGVDTFGMPTTRSFGFNIKVLF